MMRMFFRLIGVWEALALLVGVSSWAPAARPRSLTKPSSSVASSSLASLPATSLCLSHPPFTPTSRSSRCAGRRRGPVALASSGGTGDVSDDESRAPMELPPHSAEEEEAAAAAAPPATLAGRARAYFGAPSDGLTFRQRLAKLGLNVALSYGWVSNMSYSVTVSLAWYLFSRRTGCSPLAPGQWKGFLAVYAGFWVFNNLVRPLRVALAVGVSPAFDRIVRGLQNRLRLRRGTAVLLTVLLANLVGTTVCMSAGILLAATLAGVPVFAR